MSRALILVLALAPVLAHADPEDLRPAPPPPSTPQAPAAAEVAAGDQLYSEGRFREAAAQYEGAYALDPSVAVLERLANAYERSGDTARAAVLRQRLETLRNPPPPAYEVALAQPPPPRVVLKPKNVRVGSSLVRTGLGMFAGAYTASVISGAITLSVFDSGTDNEDVIMASKMLFIPVVGPFISCHWNSDPLWVAPLVLNGLLQTAGLTMTIVGGAMMARKPASPTVRLSPWSTGTTSGLAFDGSF
jgi:hypothetical protein